ncbi:hypothetical protein KXD40_000475 [Peronospora effusa]|uniref:Uncharacterized protein n=1 Tax=Peronospora effusa TaxID=542832 RepID=A0A3M6VLJ6_9STRA|nr:hypothetical protein DD238_004036 [Peronospora effusa]UIZ21351.1 hypothetical protein KXD40_000475 [Peronospora effusa]
MSLDSIDHYMDTHIFTKSYCDIPHFQDIPKIRKPFVHMAHQQKLVAKCKKSFPTGEPWDEFLRR